MSFHTLLESIIEKEGINVQFFFVRLNDIEDKVDGLLKTAEFYAKKQETTDQDKSIMASTLNRAKNALEAADKVINYATLGQIPEIKAKYEEIVAEVNQIEEVLKDKVDEASLAAANTKSFVPIKNAYDEMMKYRTEEPDEEPDLSEIEDYDISDLDDPKYDEVENTMERFNKDVKDRKDTAIADDVMLAQGALLHKYAKRFNSFKTFLNIRFTELKNRLKITEPVQLDFEDCFDNENEEGMVYARIKDEDLTKIYINQYPLYLNFKNGLSAKDVIDIFVEEEVLEHELAHLMDVKHNGSRPLDQMHDDTFKSELDAIHGKITNRLQR